jgi:hypothetical protein
VNVPSRTSLAPRTVQDTVTAEHLLNDKNRTFRQLLQMITPSHVAIHRPPCQLYQLIQLQPPFFNRAGRWTATVSALQSTGRPMIGRDQVTIQPTRPSSGNLRDQLDDMRTNRPVEFRLCMRELPREKRMFDFGISSVSSLRATADKEVQEETSSG